MKEMRSSSWVEVSSSALLNNIKITKRGLAKSTRFFAVVKANAYGHGLDLVAKTVEPYVDGFCVASTAEALQLKMNDKIKKRVLAISYFTTLNKQQLILLKKYDIEIPIISLEQLKKVAKSNISIKAHIKLDVGTTRIGIRPEEKTRLFKILTRAKRLNIVGVYSHFAEAEKKGSEFTKKQVKIFKTFSETIEIFLGKKLEKHIACSAAALMTPESHFNAVRVGIHLYGLSGIGVIRKLRPALSWKTNVVQVKKVPKWSTIGYNRSYRLKKNSRIGIIPVGYWDGFDRRLSNKGFVVINGIKCPVRGSVCMNLTMVDVSAVKALRPSNEVLLIDNTVGSMASADKQALKCKTINYEIVTRINPQIPRILVP